VAKKKQKPTKKIPVQQHISHLEREKKHQIWVIGAGALVIVSAVAILVVGLVTQWFIPVYLPLQKTVVTADSQSYNMRYLVQAIQFYSGGNSSYYSELVNPVAQQIADGYLISQAAAKEGISVSDADVNAAIKANGYANNQAVKDAVRSQLLYQQLIKQVFDKQIPSSADQRDALVMFLESQSEAQQVEARLAAGEDFATIVKELSLDTTTVTDNGDLGYHSKATFFDDAVSATGLDDHIFSGNVGDIGYFYDASKTKELGYWIVKITSSSTQNGALTVHAYGILLSSEADAQTALNRLNSGESFASVAADMSQDSASKSNGGDLGTRTQGSSSDAYDSYIFSATTGLNQLSQPIKDTTVSTTGGYWLYLIQGDKTAPISDADRSTLEQNAYQDWSNGIITAAQNEIKISLTDTQEAFAVEQASK
jgi:parvulin-like peptidyl-prolyl isomerase